MVAVTPVIITALPVPLPFAIVRVVPDCGAKAVEAADTETIVPPLSALVVLMSGLVAGKLVSFGIGTKPPTLSTSSITRKSIAPVVATKASEPVHVLPEEIVSLESCLNYLASVAEEVKKDVSFTVTPDCSLDVTTVASLNLSEVIDPAA